MGGSVGRGTKGQHCSPALQLLLEVLPGGQRGPDSGPQKPQGKVVGSLGLAWHISPGIGQYPAEQRYVTPSTVIGRVRLQFG